MIIIPAMGRTRSSLVAGIFHACGAWVGDSTVSMWNRHDTFENWDTIMYLQHKFGCRSQMSGTTARKQHHAFRKWVNSVVPDDELVCLKVHWYYDRLLRRAFPDADYYFVHRAQWSDTIQKKRQMFRHYQREMGEGKWIDGERLVQNPPDFDEMKSVIGQHSALKWNQQAVDAVYASNGAERYGNMIRVRR